MKLVVAVIPSERLDAVEEVVDDTQASIICVGEAMDVRRRRGAIYRGVEFMAPRPRLRLEIAVWSDAWLEPVLDAIREAADGSSADPRGCGDLMVLPLEACETIRHDPVSSRPATASTDLRPAAGPRSGRG
jgi:nitrogen regulatory protein PII